MERKNKIRSLLLGSAVGDALGVPYEFRKRGTFECTDMVGYGSHSQPKGTWSDDTSMTLCLAEQIADGFDYHKLASKFLKWVNEGYMTAHGNVFDIGGATSSALLNVKLGHNPIKCGGTGEFDNGNGSLMRIAPLVFYKTDFETVKNVSSITHAHDISVSACYIYIKFLEGILSGLPKGVVYNGILAHLDSDFWKSVLVPNLSEVPETEIKSGGYVVDTLKASIWCFLTTDNYKDCVLKAVNLGSDTDTTACVAGAIAGLYYGEKSIPTEWLGSLAKADLIIDIAERM